MIYKDLYVALLTFILRFLNGGHRRWRGADPIARRLLCAAHRHGCRHAKKRRKKDARTTLDPEHIRRTGGNPGAGPSNTAATAASPQPAPRQDQWVRPPSPSLERVAERLRESETQQPLRPMRYCPLHGWGRALLANHELLHRMQTPPLPVFDRAGCSSRSPLQRALMPGHGSLHESRPALAVVPSGRSHQRLWQTSLSMTPLLHLTKTSRCT
jgi:hypothetical protein